MNKIGLVVVDRQEIFRTGIVAIIDSYKAANLRLVKAGKNIDEVTETLLGEQVGIIILGISSADDFLMCYKLQQLNLNVKVVLLIEVNIIERSLQLLSLGFNGYLLKDISQDSLKDAVTQVLAGETPVATEFTSYMLGQLRKIKGTAKVKTERQTGGPLTAREREILKLIVKGTSNATIAGELVITENTVKNHIRNMMQKLKLQNRVQLATYGIETGLKVEG